MYKAFTFSVSRANNWLTLALLISLSWGCYKLCKKSNWGLLFISQQWWVVPLWMLNCHNTPVLLCCCLVSLWAVIPMNCPFTKKKKLKKILLSSKEKATRVFLLFSMDSILLARVQKWLLLADDTRFHYAFSKNITIVCVKILNTYRWPQWYKLLDG